MVCMADELSIENNNNVTLVISWPNIPGIFHWIILRDVYFNIELQGPFCGSNPVFFQIQTKHILIPISFQVFFLK